MYLRSPGAGAWHVQAGTGRAGNMKNGEITMKTKMSLSAEMNLTQESVVQLTCWCGQIALHELWGLGRTRLDRITRRKELLDRLKGTEVRV
jgi:hypothetical protein